MLQGFGPVELPTVSGRYSGPELSRTVGCQSRPPFVAAAVTDFSRQVTVQGSYCCSAELAANSKVKVADTK